MKAVMSAVSMVESSADEKVDYLAGMTAEKTVGMKAVMSDFYLVEPLAAYWAVLLAAAKVLW
jgi:hypothetical protein